MSRRRKTYPHGRAAEVFGTARRPFPQTLWTTMGGGHRRLEMRVAIGPHLATTREVLETTRRRRTHGGPHNPHVSDLPFA